MNNPVGGSVFYIIRFMNIESKVSDDEPNVKSQAARGWTKSYPYIRIGNDSVVYPGDFLHVAFIYSIPVKRLPLVNSTLLNVDGSKNKICRGHLRVRDTYISPPRVSSSDASVWKQRRRSTPGKLKQITKIAQTVNSLDAKVCIFKKNVN